MDQSAPLTEIQAADLGSALTRNAWYSPLTFQTGTWLIGHLPRPLARTISATGAELGYRLCKKRREALMSNLEVISPEIAHRKRLAWRSFHNFLRMLHDFCDCAASGSGRVNAFMHERRGFEFLDAGRRHGKGILLITGHLGAWELGGMVLAADGFPVNVVTMAEPTRELNEWRRKYRERFGIKTITVGSDKFAFVEIIQALRRNELVAMLVDRPYLNSGVAVRFFERSTLFSSAAARIWQYTQTTVIPAFVIQLRPERYGCYAYPPIDMTPDGALQENSQRIANVFQAVIREFPEQWYNFVPIWHH
jgi:lauroyl/myristoyl acyltransferase